MKACMFAVVGFWASLAFAGNDWYVDVRAPDNGWDGSQPTNDVGTTKGPKRTLQAAVERAESGDIVHVAPGIYNEGEVWAGSNSNRVYISKKNVGLVADQGKEVTFIEGRFSALETITNCGPDSVRAVYITGANSYVRGFTIRNGSTSVGSTPQNNGGNLSGGAAIDCVITNGAASNRGAAYNAKLISTIVYPSPYGQKYAAYDCSGYNSVFKGGNVYGNGTMLNCTFLGTGYTGRSSGQPCYNSYLEATKKNAAHYRCYYVGTMKTDSTADGDCRQITKDDANVDAVTFRPLKGSVLRDAGSDDYYTNQYVSAFKEAFGAYDFALTVRHRGAAIDIGALEGDWADEFADILSGTNAFFSVTDVSPAACTNDARSVALPTGAELTGAWANPSGAGCPSELSFTVSVSDGAVLKVYLNGAAEPAWTILAADGVKTVTYLSTTADTLRFVCEGADGKAVLSAFTSTAHQCVYADAVNGNDAWDGSVDYAHRDVDAGHGPTLSLQRAVDLAQAGQTVYAARGVYDAGASWDGDNSNRVYISKARLGLVAYEGRDVTFIEGRLSPAIRAVRITGSGSYVRGFTLRNGSTVTGSKSDVPYCGGAICGGTAIGCVITNSASGYRGAAFGSRLIGCLVYPARGDDYAAFECSACNSVFDGALEYGNGVILNCTFRNTGPQGKNDGVSVYNSYIEVSKKNATYYRCCYVGSLHSSAKTNDNCRQVTKQEADVDPVTFRPRKGSVLLDAASEALYEEKYLADYKEAFGGCDFGGGQRIYNGRLDIGAGEYDWRGDYGDRLKHLKRYALVVVSASPAVTTNALGGVTLTDGTELAVDWTLAEAGEVSFAVARTGDGTLAATCDGMPVAIDPLTGRGSVNVGAGTHSLLFAFSGQGTATLTDFCEPRSGLLMLVR